MKTLTSTILFLYLVSLLGIVGLFAQDAPRKSSFKTKFIGGKKIVLNLDPTRLSIEGYNGEEVIIEAENAPQIPEEAKGLRPLSAGGTDNTGLGVAVVTTNGTMTISTVLKNNDSGRPTSYKLKIPRQVALSYKQGSGWSGKTLPVIIANIDGEVTIRTNDIDIELNNVTGPIVAKSSNGKIKVMYNDKISEKPSSFVSFSDIDITVSEKAQVAFSINSGFGNSGNIFTDLDLKTVNTTEKKSINKSYNLAVDITSIAPAPPKPPKPNNIKGVSSITVRDSASKSQITVTDSSGSTDLVKMAMELNEMSTEIANTELAELSETMDFGKKSTSYVLNDGKTKISIRSSGGNIFLRKK